MPDPEAAVKDVFISYTSADQAWADWLAWVLEENGYTVRLRPWDFRPDGDLILNLHSAASPGEQQVLVVLSENYQRMQAPIPDWPAQNHPDADAYYKWLADADFRLLPVLVDECEPVGVFAALPRVSLVKTSEVEAESLLLEAWEACLAAQPIASPPQAVSTGIVAPAAQFQARATVGGSGQIQSQMLTLPADYEYRDQLKLRQRTATVQGYRERLTDNLSLEMIQIPAGRFLMGSPEDEPERRSNEGPQHEVQVPEFFMGKYPVTQAEWRWVAGLPQINRELKSDSSRFKGDRHPVESVNWYDAVEFCDRLSLHTGRTYRLPSEAEWEYACRAKPLPPELSERGEESQGPPFHFGETITTELANYNGTDDPGGNWSGSYGRGPKGEYRQTTTPVDHFGVTNDFGLCDMHGNVWEWCLDHYHESYEGAPTNGSAWIDSDAEENQSRILRGGSWDYAPRDCRSAFRGNSDPRVSNSGIGFRVVSVAPRAQGSHLASG